jgi:hypothetical protein
MSDQANHLPHPKNILARFDKWLEVVWVVMLVILVVIGVNLYRSAVYCPFMGTDFRGYYAAAQIARQHGMAEVYNQGTQAQFQADLPLRCPDGSYAPAQIEVSMPYLPLFVLIFLPLTLLDFSNAYYLWLIINLVALLLYLMRFTTALGMRAGFKRVLQWGLCLPLFSNLVLGQVNVLLVILLGEFVLAWVSDNRFRAGFWLGGLLIKPHMLILLIPGLAVSRERSIMLGFSGSALVILLASTLLAGWDGLLASLNLAGRFLGPLIDTGPTMMNFRSVALNLESMLPSWLSWATAISGMIAVLVATLILWRRYYPKTNGGSLILISATLAGTFAVSWHSHFYMLMLLLPFLLALDSKGRLSLLWRWAWVAAPPLFFAMLFGVNPDMARNWFGLGMLALNLFLLTWAVRILTLQISAD